MTTSASQRTITPRKSQKRVAIQLRNYKPHDYSTRLKDKPDGDFVMHFAINWLNIVHERKLVVRHLVDKIGMGRTTVYDLRSGKHTGYFSTYALGLLAQLIDMNILSVIEYAEYIPYVESRRSSKKA